MDEKTKAELEFEVKQISKSISKYQDPTTLNEDKIALIQEHEQRLEEIKEQLEAELDELYENGANVIDEPVNRLENSIKRIENTLDNISDIRDMYEVAEEQENEDLNKALDEIEIPTEGIPVVEGHIFGEEEYEADDEISEDEIEEEQEYEADDEVSYDEIEEEQEYETDDEVSYDDIEEEQEYETDDEVSYDDIEEEQEYEADDEVSYDEIEEEQEYEADDEVSYDEIEEEQEYETDDEVSYDDIEEEQEYEADDEVSYDDIEEEQEYEADDEISEDEVEPSVSDFEKNLGEVLKEAEQGLKNFKSESIHQEGTVVDDVEIPFYEEDVIDDDIPMDVVVQLREEPDSEYIKEARKVVINREDSTDSIDDSMMKFMALRGSSLQDCRKALSDQDRKNNELQKERENDNEMGERMR